MRTLALQHNAPGISVMQHPQVMTRCSGIVRAVCVLRLPLGLQLRLKLPALSSATEKDHWGYKWLGRMMGRTKNFEGRTRC